MIKIGITHRELNQRIKELNNTSVPLPFEIYYAAKVYDAKKIETLIHEIFKEDIDALDPKSREVLEKVLGYMEKKYIAGPMKLAKEIMVKHG